MEDYMNDIHVAIAEVLFSLLRENSKNALITYGDLCERIDNMVTPRNSASYLGDLSVWCSEYGAPLISVLVVNSRAYIPGSGFFDLYEEEYGIKVIDKETAFRDELEKVRLYEDWDGFAEYLLGVNDIV